MHARPIPPHIGKTYSYDPETGVITSTDGRTGRPAKGGYLRVFFEGKYYAVHQVAWFLMTGRSAPLIDHKDRNRTNNAWSNLREATYTQNNANWPARRGKRLKGCTPLGRKFQVQLKKHGTSYYVGLFDTEEEAHAAYVAKAKELFGEFARAA